MSIRILFVGDVFGRPGRELLNRQLPPLKSALRVDLCIANGENSAGGKGITFDVAQQLYASGVDVITLGNHAWDNKNVFTFIDSDERIVRALNYPPDTPGRGATTVTLRDGIQVTVTQLIGRLFMSPADCPFRAADALLETLPPNRIVIAEAHCEATSEKQALGWHLAGRVSAVLGTHTHVPTADERILPDGTAYMTDVGMSGPYDSVIGMNIEHALYGFLWPIRKPYRIAEENLILSAALIEVDETSGRALSIERISQNDMLSTSTHRGEYG